MVYILLSHVDVQSSPIRYLRVTCLIYTFVGERDLPHVVLMRYSSEIASQNCHVVGVSKQPLFMTYPIISLFNHLSTNADRL